MIENINVAQLTELAITYGTRAIGFLLFLFLVFKVANWASKVSRKAMERSKVDSALAGFGSNMLRYAVLCLGIIACLSIFGIQTVGFAAVLAAAGFAIGMALQGTLGNFASGVMLILFKPFKIGDYVMVAGTSGTVKEIEIFSTTLDTPDNRRITVPNGSVFNQQIENFSFHDIRRVQVDVGTDYAADIDKTRAVLMDAIKSISEGLEDPAPAVVLNGLGASSIDWSLRLWVNGGDFWPVRDALTRAVKYALDKEKIGIPYQTVDLNFGDDFPLKFNATQKETSAKNTMQ